MDFFIHQYINFNSYLNDWIKITLYWVIHFFC